MEDHELVRDALGISLRLAGLRAVVATDLSVEGVLTLARDTQPVVVLLDYFLDDEVDSLPMISPLAAIADAVLVLTGADDPEVWGTCLLAGAAGILDKSGGLDVVVERVRAVQQGEPAMDARDRDRLLAEARVAQSRRENRLAPFDRLTQKEAAILRQLVAGHRPEDIAREEYISIATVRNHVVAVLEKLGVSSTLAAVSVAREAGWA